MQVSRKHNPTPAVKLLATLMFSMGLTRPLEDFWNILTILVFAVFFCLNNRCSTGIKAFLFYLPLTLLTDMDDISHWNVLAKICISLFMVVKMFYLPFLAGKFFIATADVGSIITSMDRIRIPQSVSIPVAVMFRFFPAYRVESANIKLAMKMRGITYRNPFRYLEYVGVPLLIVSSNIAEDISRAAETKCIADPCRKERFTEVRFRTTDALFIALLLLIQAGGRFYG